MEEEEIRRRLRAARVLAGFERVDDLAEALNIAGLGRDTLYKIEAGKRPVQPHELRPIAEACGLPHQFFTVDLGRLPELEGDFSHASGEDLRRQIEGIRDLMGEVIQHLEARKAADEAITRVVAEAEQRRPEGERTQTAPSSSPPAEESTA